MLSTVPNNTPEVTAGPASIVLPTALNTSSTYLGELDNGSGNTLSTPTVAPDIIAKLAFDPNKHVHFEIGGIERNFKVYYPGAAASGATAAIPANHFSAEGGGGFVNLQCRSGQRFTPADEQLLE